MVSNFLSVHQKDELLLSKVLEDGVDINYRDELGNSALMIASSYGSYEIAEILLRVDGIDVNATNHEGATALIMASGNGHRKIIKMLLKIDSIEVNAFYKHGETALTVLICASQQNYTENVEILLGVSWMMLFYIKVVTSIVYMDVQMLLKR